MTAPWEILLIALVLVIFLSVLASQIIEKTLNRQPSVKTGRESFSWRISLSELGTLGAIIVLIALIAVPNFKDSRKAANEASAAASIRDLNAALQEYKSAYGSYPSSLSGLKRQNWSPIDTNIMGEIRGGYLFRYEPIWAERNGQPVVTSYDLVAEPLAKKSDKKTFRTSADGVIDYSLDGSTWKPLQ